MRKTGQQPDRTDKVINDYTIWVEEKIVINTNRRSFLKGTTATGVLCLRKLSQDDHRGVRLTARGVDA